MFDSASSGIFRRSSTAGGYLVISDTETRCSVAQTINVIDIFAGPGGLGEGFHGFADAKGNHPFRIIISAEMEKNAHATLSMRALSRLISDRGDLSDIRRLRALEAALSNSNNTDVGHFADQLGLKSAWDDISRKILNIELGTCSGDQALIAAMKATPKGNERLVVIGGPPCQAYSLAGRVRNRGKADYKPESDPRHFLYRQYLTLLSERRPDAFVMENVKGILSSRIAGEPIFPKILSDLSDPNRALRKRSDGARYRFLALTPRHGSRDLFDAAAIPADFVVRAEDHGVPQARHRVIIVGIRDDIDVPDEFSATISDSEPMRTAGEVLGDLPPLRSGVNERGETRDNWLATVNEARNDLLAITRGIDRGLSAYLKTIVFDNRLSRNSSRYILRKSSSFVKRWYRSEIDPGLIHNHETRTHMKGDLMRYLYFSSFAAIHGRSPTSSNVPDALAPNHANWTTGDFADRFRVVLPDKPSGTVTSHLGKDGHQFIHWIASQCRSLTVREAARLQTFPDDYLFLGPRTSQYTQVGNAVPPYLARKIAKLIFNLLS